MLRPRPRAIASVRRLAGRARVARRGAGRAAGAAHAPRRGAGRRPGPPRVAEPPRPGATVPSGAPPSNDAHCGAPGRARRARRARPTRRASGRTRRWHACTASSCAGASRTAHGRVRRVSPGASPPRAPRTARGWPPPAHRDPSCPPPRHRHTEEGSSGSTGQENSQVIAVGTAYLRPHTYTPPTYCGADRDLQQCHSSAATTGAPRSLSAFDGVVPQGLYKRPRAVDRLSSPGSVTRFAARPVWVQRL